MATPEGFNDLKPLIRSYLRQSEQPMTFQELYDIPEIRSLAPSPNRVSDYLGVMFRAGELSRLPAEGGEQSRARWKYIWKEKVTPEMKTLAREYRPKPILDRPNLHISEDGSCLTLEMPEILIQIQIKKR